MTSFPVLIKQDIIVNGCQIKKRMNVNKMRMSVQNDVHPQFYKFRQQYDRNLGLIINIIVTGNLPGVVAIHFNNLRKIIVYGIELQLMVSAPRYSLFQGFSGSTGPEYQFIA